MAQFGDAISKTILLEGGYSNDPSDSGGETYEGISRNNWPTWSGWPIIDGLKYLKGFPGILNTQYSLGVAVINFYRANFWQYDGLNDQPSANKIFDLSVNIGKEHAVKIVQRLCGDTEDGEWGPNTEASVNHATLNGSLLPALKLAAESYHEEIVAEHSEDAKFLDGWLKRDQS